MNSTRTKKIELNFQKIFATSRFLIKPVQSNVATLRFWDNRQEWLK